MEVGSHVPFKLQCKHFNGGAEENHKNKLAKYRPLYYCLTQMVKCTHLVLRGTTFAIKDCQPQYKQNVNNSNSVITVAHSQSSMTILNGFKGKTAQLCDISSHIELLPKLDLMKDQCERISKVEYSLNTPTGTL